MRIVILLILLCLMTGCEMLGLSGCSAWQGAAGITGVDGNVNGCGYKCTEDVKDITFTCDQDGFKFDKKDQE